MSGDITIDAVRLALGLQELQARVAATNIANAGRPGAQALQVDTLDLQALLQETAAGAADGASLPDRLQRALAGISQAPTVVAGETIQVDAQVSDMVAASTSYQALSEALSRQFGLMRLAIAGRN